MKAALGLDFGTESVRAVLVDLRGRELASAVAKYPHGQIIESLPGSKKKKLQPGHLRALYREYRRIGDFLSAKSNS